MTGTQEVKHHDKNKVVFFFFFLAVGVQFVAQDRTKGLRLSVLLT